MTQELLSVDIDHGGDILRRIVAASESSYPIPMLKRVHLKNFKSINQASIELFPLTVLVGPNGSGKSNFIDGIRLTSDALSTSLENAVRERGGVNEVRRKSRGHPTNIAIQLDLDISSCLSARYSYTIGAKKSSMAIQRETCEISIDGRRVISFTTHDGVARTEPPVIPPLRVSSETLALQVLGGMEYFRCVLSAIQDIGFYSLNPDRMRELQDPDTGDMLMRDGGNLAALIRATGARSPATLERIVSYLGSVVPGVKDVNNRALGPKETLEFMQEVRGDENPWRFFASSMSDGTLRALGVIAAALQQGADLPGIPLVVIEEPEVAIHPGAGLKVMDALLEASTTRQLIITTHSPDLLEHDELRVESLVAVSANEGVTVLGPVDEATREAVRQELFTPGELLRQNQIEPGPVDASVKQGRLF